MTPLRLLLHDAAGPPARDVDLERIHSDASRMRARRSAARGAALALASIVVVVAVVVVARPDREHAVARFPLPSVGSVVGSHLTDGTPVWIVHLEEDTIHVIGAENPETPAVDARNGAPLNHSWAPSWCPTTEHFESIWGSQFDPDGVLGGPAPLGLPRYPIKVEGGVVTVTSHDPLPGLDGRNRGETRAQIPSDEFCDLGPSAVRHPEWDDLQARPAGEGP